MLQLLVASTAFSIQPAAVTRQPRLHTPRLSAPQLCDKKKDDPYNSPELNNGFTSLLPNRGAILWVAAIGGTSLLFGDTPIGRALNAPLFRTVDKGEKVDDAGIPYATDKGLAPTGGLALFAGYQVVRRVIQPRLAKMARESKQPPTTADDDSNSPPPPV
tara:strand:- start:144 stop:623 length:480 start_codon:yes stop_codon:yes gene_type:complete